VSKILGAVQSKERKMFFENNYDTLNTRFNSILSEYNIEGNLHSIRHTFITKMRRIKNIVGHKVKDVTDGVYTHWSIEELREVINKLVY